MFLLKGNKDVRDYIVFSNSNLTNKKDRDKKRHTNDIIDF